MAVIPENKKKIGKYRTKIKIKVKGIKIYILRN